MISMKVEHKAGQTRQEEILAICVTTEKWRAIDMHLK